VVGRESSLEVMVVDMIRCYFRSSILILRLIRSDRLQANTMLMYPLGEAVLLLSEKLSTAKKNLNNIKEDLEFLREQVTVMEVNFARVHNVSLFGFVH
jgi:hypothetical protein